MPDHIKPGLGAAAVHLRSPTLNVEIDPLGAQLSVLRDAGARDLLWSGDPSVWSGRAPLLFPIVGTLVDGAYRLGSASYRLPRHGFARGRMFSIVGANSTAATFRLCNDTATREVYPFQFELEVRFTLEKSTLRVVARLRNPGSGDLPASLGFHPALRWPLPFGRPRAAHFVEFAMDEADTVRRLDADGLLAPEPRPTPIVDRRLSLDDSLFQNDVLILDKVRSRSVTYGAVDGPRLRVDFPGTPYLGFWSKPGADFVCIEPWHGHSDPAGFTGDFRDKPGVFSVSPGDTRSIEMSITLLDS